MCDLLKLLQLFFFFFLSLATAIVMSMLSKVMFLVADAAFLWE